MFFLQAARAPVVVMWGDKKLLIPKFTVGESIEWAAEIQANMAENATAGLDEEKKVQYLTFYPVLPPTKNELRRMVMTDSGAKYVCETCLKKASIKDERGITRASGPDGTNQAISNEEIKEIIEANHGRLVALAAVLFDFNDTSLLVDPSKLPQEPQEDPTTAEERTDSENSQMIGDANSTSSAQPTPEKISENIRGQSSRKPSKTSHQSEPLSAVT